MATASSSESGCTYFQEMKRSFSRRNPPSPHFRRKPLKEMSTWTTTIRPLDSSRWTSLTTSVRRPSMSRIVLPIRCSFEQHPAGLIDEGGISVAAFGRLDEDGVGVDLHHAIPRE